MSEIMKNVNYYFLFSPFLLGFKGYWIFQLNNVKNEQTMYVSLCKSWYDKQTEQDRIHVTELDQSLPVCPCGLETIQWDNRFVPFKSSQDWVCYVSFLVPKGFTGARVSQLHGIFLFICLE